VAWLTVAHRRLIGDNELQGEGSHYRASPGTVWSEVQGMDVPRRRPHDAQGAQRGASRGDRRLDGWQEGEHGRRLWTMVHPPDTVEGTSSQ
jgi:hypothetical protein